MNILKARNGLGRKLLAISAGSLFFMTLKAVFIEGLVHLNEWPVWLNYAIVTVSISLLGWVYHAKVSFSQDLTRLSLRRYIEQAAGLKLLDYILFNLAVYTLGIRPVVAVVAISAVTFVSRIIIYMHYVYKGPKDEDGKEESFKTGQAYDSGSDYGKYLGSWRSLHAARRREVPEGARIASGGIVTSLLSSALASGIVDGVALSRCNFKEGDCGYDFDIVTDPDAVPAYGSSAYFNIPLERHWKKLEAFPGRLALCALPCHTWMLRMRQEKRGGAHNVTHIISLFCGHNNETELIRFVFEKARVPLDQVVDFQVRRSYLGGDIDVRLRDGSVTVIPFRHFNVYRSLWMFSKNMCRNCDDHLGVRSDISIGDIFIPRFRARGVKYSAIMVRTEAGAALWEAAKGEGLFDTETIAPADVFSAQRRVLVPSADLLSRHHALRLNGYASRKPEYGRFRLRSFVTYYLLLLNDRISRRKWGRRVIGWIPRPLLYAYIASIKLVNNSLKP